MGDSGEPPDPGINNTDTFTASSEETLTAGSTKDLGQVTEVDPQNTSKSISFLKIREQQDSESSVESEASFVLKDGFYRLKETVKEIEDNDINYKKLYEDLAKEFENYKEQMECKEIPIVIENKALRGQCTNERCEDDQDKHRLQCKECKRWVHYTCSRLPLYQIEYFVRKSRYRNFVCESCTTIQPSLLEACIEISTVETSKSEIDFNILKKDHTKLFNEAKDLQNRLEIKNNECTKLELSRKTLIEKIENLENKTIEKDEEIETRKNEIENLKKIKVNEVGPSDMRQAEEGKSNNVEKIIDDKLKNFEKKIEQVMTMKLESVCQSLQEKVKEANKTIVDIPTKMNESFKHALTKNLPATNIPDFKQVLSDERNSQLVQEREKKRRATNIIIHGVHEAAENKSQQDKQYVKDLLSTLGVECTLESIVRLGSEDLNNQKKRPLKIRFQCEEDKRDVMSRLSNLKKAEDRFKKISITDDYTMEERQEIRRFVDEAKKKNNNENGNFYWRVRGSPKTGLELRKVLKKEM